MAKFIQVKSSMMCITVTLCLLVTIQSHAQTIHINGVPGSIVAYSAAATKVYLGSPSLAVLANGDYMASHDMFGPESSEYVQAVSRIYRSPDKGRTWRQVSEVNGAFWSKLFVHRDVLYFIGTDRHHGTLLIRKSNDDGATWTKPTSYQNGLLLAGEYHCAPTPIIEHKGRLWRAMELAFGPVRIWGKRYGTFMMSAPVDADLLKASSWTSSDSLLFDSTYLNGNFHGWCEGNAVVDRQGNIANILRVDDRTTFEEKAAIVTVSADGKRSSFDPKTGFIPFPGGSKKFVVHYDEKSEMYWTLANYITRDFYKEVSNYPVRIRSSRVRNTLALCSSKDLYNWKVNEIILQDTSVAKHGFQYVDWQFEGDDIIFLSRTGYDDKEGGANNCHDSNFITFHRIKKFRKLKDKQVF